MDEQKQKIASFLEKYSIASSIVLAAVIISGTIFFTRVPIGASNPGTDKIGDVVGKDQAPNGEILKINSNEHILGQSSAKVSLVIYTDFQCPFCRTYWKDSYQKIVQNYINSGKIKLVIRHFPLDFHPAARPSAEAIECAGDQGKFWQLQDKIFQEQEKRGQGTIQFTKDDIIKWAGAVGINMGTLTRCVNSGKYAQKITDDLTSGKVAGVTGTPTTFINDQKIVGAQPFENFKTAIDQLLK